MCNFCKGYFPVICMFILDREAHALAHLIVWTCTLELTLTLPCFSEPFMLLISNHYLAILGFLNSPARAYAFLLKTLRLPAVITFSKTKQWTVVSQAIVNRYFWIGEALSSRWMRVNLSTHKKKTQRMFLFCIEY